MSELILLSQWAPLPTPTARFHVCLGSEPRARSAGLGCWAQGTTVTAGPNPQPAARGALGPGSRPPPPVGASGSGSSQEAGQALQVRTGHPPISLFLVALPPSAGCRDLQVV